MSQAEDKTKTIDDSTMSTESKDTDSKTKNKTKQSEDETDSDTSSDSLLEEMMADCEYHYSGWAWYGDDDKISDAPQFSECFSELIKQYRTPVKRTSIKRPLDMRTITQIVHKTLHIFGGLRMEPVEGDPTKYVVHLTGPNFPKEQPALLLKELEDIRKFEIRARYPSNYIPAKAEPLQHICVDKAPVLSPFNRSNTFVQENSSESSASSLQKFLQSLTDSDAKLVENFCAHVLVDLKNRKKITSQQTSTQTQQTSQTSTQTQQTSQTSTQTQQTLQISTQTQTSIQRERSVQTLINDAKRSSTLLSVQTPTTIPATKSAEDHSTTARRTPSPRNTIAKEKKSPRGSSNISPSTNRSSSAGSFGFISKNPKYAHVQSTIPKATSAAKKRTQ